MDGRRALERWRRILCDLGLFLLVDPSREFVASSSHLYLLSETNRSLHATFVHQDIPYLTYPEVYIFVNASRGNVCSLNSELHSQYMSHNSECRAFRVYTDSTSRCPRTDLYRMMITRLLWRIIRRHYPETIYGPHHVRLQKLALLTYLPYRKSRIVFKLEN
jgi:hypothetical protein